MSEFQRWAHVSWIFSALLCLCCSGATLAQPTRLRWEAAASAFKEETEELLNFQKMILYNRVFGLSRCLADNHSSSEALDLCEKAFLERLKQLYRASEEQPVSKLQRCYAVSRLKIEEAEFPPFDFLRGQETHLYNLQKLTDCVTSR
jgi:hypothetical protein